MNLLSGYVRLSIRQARQKKLYAIISISGLALSILATLIIANYVGFERSYDRMHEHYNRIYRVTTEWNPRETPDDKRATTVQWSGPGVKEAFPEVEAFTRLMPLSRMTGDNKVEYKGKSISETDIMMADPGFFKVFSFHVRLGDTATMLSKPQSVVISENVAKKYFPDSNPLGQVLHINTFGHLNDDEFTVTGVIEDTPVNSHFRYDFLISFNSLWDALNNGSTYWHWDNTYCYLLLRGDTNVPSLEQKITEARVKNFGSEFNDWTDVIEFKLQPLRDIHLYSSLKGEIDINSNGQYLDFLVILAFGILLSACINFVNLSVSRMMERQKEIGIRKVTGSTRGQLFTQFGIETLLIVVAALLAGVAMLPVARLLIEEISVINWPVNYIDFIRPLDYVVIGAVILLMLLLSFVFPLSVISSIKPALVLKGKMMPLSGVGSARNYLVVVQFVFCLLFSVAAVVLYFQMQFMRTHDPGFDREQVMVVRGYGFQHYNVHEEFRARLLGNPSVSSIAMSSAAPGDEVIELGLRPRISVVDSLEVEAKRHSVDDQFFTTLGISFAAGRNFDRNNPSDIYSAILNEEAAKALGYKDPKDALLMPVNGLAAKPLTVIGVIKNFHQRSYKSNHEPIVFVPIWVDSPGWDKKYHFLKLDPPANAPADWYAEQTTSIQKIWNDVAPEHPFSYFFLDSYLDRQYQSDVNFGSLFSFFSIFAIAVTLMGLFGVVANMTIYRTREIGIRKVLGAGLGNILLLLSKSFAQMVLVAALIAIPVAILATNAWLESFAFRIDVRPWMLIAPVVIIDLVVVLVVMLRSIKVVSANPVDSLKCE